MNIYGVVGWKNNGKTTLVEGLVRTFTARGLSISTIKHAHHGFDIDQPGRDSFRHREAGAREVLVGSAKRWALMHEVASEDEPGLEDLLARLTPVDLVIVEGYKRDSHPKIEVRRAEALREPISANDATVRAIATDAVVAGEALPQFGLDDLDGIARFIAADLELPGWR